MRFLVLGLGMVLGVLLGVAGCSPYEPPASSGLSVTTFGPPPITGTVVVQPQP